MNCLNQSLLPPAATAAVDLEWLLKVDSGRQLRANTVAATCGTGQGGPSSPIFAPRDVGLTDRAPDADVDAMFCIEHDFFADAQSGTGEYGLG